MIKTNKGKKQSNELELTAYTKDGGQQQDECIILKNWNNCMDPGA